jgi:predicted Rossmann fold nucleotide-binding protein DprA/Smf involved in DNA uptake
MTTIALSADGQAIALACSTIALQGDRSLKPLSPTEWHHVSRDLQDSNLRPRDLLGLGAGELRESIGLSADAAARLAALLARGGQLALEVERLSSQGIWIVTRADDTYPPRLKQQLKRQAPPLLFGAGPTATLSAPAIAIVGSRDVDSDGLAFAKELGRRCAAQEFAVVSGAARGVDLAAMTAAIDRGGSAIGITVDPLERLVRRAELRTAIVDEQLTLATPFHPGARWHAGNAMRRNRLVYALSRAAVVVASAADGGGTRAGAVENLKAGWVPLHVRADGGPGTRRLIEEGGRALAPNTLLDQIDVDRLTRDPQATMLDEVAAGSGATAPPDAGPSPADASDDAFVTVWPILARHLREPVDERRIANDLSLELTQARAWLKRAVAEGYAEVRKRPKRYVLREAHVEQLRIDGA